MPEQDPNLSTGRTDIVAAALRSVAGAIPVIGALVSEVVSSLVPNQRVDRIAEMLYKLSDKMRGQEALLEKRGRSKESVDLIEDGLYQATRALSPVRREQIAAALKNSLSNDALSHLQKKRLLQILGELNDLEIILLKGYELGVSAANPEFFERNKAILKGPVPFQSTHTGALQEDVDAAAVYGSYRNHLLQLGLVKGRFRAPRHGQAPQFDYQTGGIKASSSIITSLGRLLLRFIDESGELEAGLSAMSTSAEDAPQGENQLAG